MCDSCADHNHEHDEQMERLRVEEDKLDSWTVEYDRKSHAYFVVKSPTGLYSREEAEYLAHQRAALTGASVAPIIRTSRRTHKRYPIQ